MCGCGENTQKTSSVSKVPKWMEAEGQSLYNRANAGSDYTPYGGPIPVAPLSGREGDSFGMIEGLIDEGNPYKSEIENLIRGYSSGGPRLIDNIPGGPGATGGEGSIQDYMNPYLAEVLGPMLREISEKGEMDRNRLGSEATMAGAFGDSRHGVESGMQRADENQLRTDTTGKVTASAFDTAMGLRGDDINRLLQNMRAGAGDLITLDKHETGRQTGLAEMLGRAGATERGIEDRSRAFEFEEFLRKEGWDVNMARQLSQILTAAPYTKRTESTTTTENNDVWKEIAGIAGSLMGAGFPSMGGASSSAFGAAGTMTPTGFQASAYDPFAGWR